MIDLPYKQPEMLGIMGSETYSQNPVSFDAKFAKVASDKRSYISVSREWYAIEGTLRSEALMIYRWICMQLEWNSDVVRISPIEVNNALGYKSPASVFIGINHLLYIGALFRKSGKKKYYYYINVNYFFYGDAPGGAHQQNNQILREE